MQPKALVTGASGFIGSHLVEALIPQKWDITCLIRPTSRTGFLQKLKVKLAVHDPSNPASLEMAVRGQDYIFHLAGRIRSASRRAYNAANYQLTKDLVQACLKENPGLKRFVYVSSIAAAGPSFPGKYSEESLPPSPESEYGRTKLKGEQSVRDSWDIIPSTIIRPPNVYGPRQQETELLVKLVSKRIVPILKERGATTSLIYVKDLVEGILQAAFSPKTRSQVYYLTDRKGYSWRSLILTMKSHILGSSFFVPVPEDLISAAAWLADVIKSTGVVRPFFGRKIWSAMTQTLWLYSTAKAEKDFGFRARYELDEGIRETVRYYRT